MHCPYAVVTRIFSAPGWSDETLVVMWPERGTTDLFPYTSCVQVLRSPKEAFAAAMQSWRERCEKCICLQGDYIEK